MPWTNTFTAPVILSRFNIICDHLSVSTSIKFLNQCRLQDYISKTLLTSKLVIKRSKKLKNLLGGYNSRILNKNYFKLKLWKKLKFRCIFGIFLNFFKVFSFPAHRDCFKDKISLGYLKQGEWKFNMNPFKALFEASIKRL